MKFSPLHYPKQSQRILEYIEKYPQDSITHIIRRLANASPDEYKYLKPEALNSNFRFAAAGGTKIKITALNTRNTGNMYITLYGVGGEVIKQTEGRGTLNIFYKIPEDGFYYISTMKDDENRLLISLTEE